MTTDPHPEIGLDDMLTWLQGRIYSVTLWLEQHAKKRGQMETDQKRNDLAHYRKLAASFTAMQERRDAQSG